MADAPGPVEIIKDFVKDWSSRYVHSLFETDGPDPAKWYVRGTWSCPFKQRPIADAVVHVDFEVEDNGKRISYTIENERTVHRSDDQIRFSETWLDDAVNNKLAIKSWFDLRTDFSRTRIHELKAEDMVDEEKVLEEVDQMVEAAEQYDDVMETLDVEQTMIDLFQQADRDGRGWLTYEEFRDLIRSAELGVPDDLIAILMQHADEDQDGRIEYREFIPLGVEILQAHEARERARYESVARLDEVDETAMQALYGPEIEDMVAAAQELFVEADKDQTGSISRSALKALLAHRNVGLMKEEINMVMGIVTDTMLAERGGGGGDGSESPRGMVSFRAFEEAIVEVRFASLKYAVGLSTDSDLAVYIQNSLSALDDGGSGRLTVHQLKVGLQSMDQIMLSRLQLCSVVSEAQVDPMDGTVDYVEFSRHAAAVIANLFDPRQLQERAKVVKRADLQPVQLMSPDDQRLVEEGLRRMFQKNDVDGNGVLDRVEFRKCLQETELGLERRDIKMLMAAADENGDGFIDYDEFIDLSRRVLLHMAREKYLDNLDMQAPDPSLEPESGPGAIAPSTAPVYIGTHEVEAPASASDAEPRPLAISCWEGNSSNPYWIYVQGTDLDTEVSGVGGREW